jgi:hypothetical protein
MIGDTQKNPALPRKLLRGSCNFYGSPWEESGYVNN